MACDYRYCFAPESSCNLGSEDYRQCAHWTGTSDVIPDEGPDDGGGRLPWSGNSFGVIDLQFVASRSNPTVIGVLGSPNAGKTTLLVASYLLLSHGRRLTGRLFSGSYTLGGWEHLAQSLRWGPPGYGPAFPPHTGSGAGRMPGLLHLALRQEDGALEDLLLTDAPGEWFERWAIDRDAPEAEGARWMARHADAFLLLADSDALAGPDRGEARIVLSALARRLGAEVRGRPVAVVWSKSDIAVPDSIRAALGEVFTKAFADYREFRASVVDHGPDDLGHAAFLDSVGALLDQGRGRAPVSILSLPVVREDDPLLAFKGR